MIDMIIETLAKVYDAIVRGICFGISFTILWIAAWTVIKYANPVMKQAGLW